MLSLQCDSFGTLAANSYLITDVDSVESALVDCPKYTQRMRNFIAGANIKYVLLTHAHFDHIAGCAKLLRDIKCMCYMSVFDSFMLTSEEANLSALFHQKCDPFPTETFDSELCGLSLGNVPISALATPGHTPGSVSYLIGNYLFTGDTVMASTVGRTDFPFGDASVLHNSIKLIGNLGDELKVCPGHDEMITMNMLKNTNPYFVALNKEGRINGI